MIFFFFFILVVKSMESQRGMDTEKSEEQSDEDGDLWQKLKDFAGYFFFPFLLNVIAGCDSP